MNAVFAMPGEELELETENKYYFFDSRIVKYSENAELRLGTAQKTVTKASWLDQYSWTTDSGIPDWEQRVTIMYPYVLYNEDGISIDGVSSAKYKIWYHSWYSGSPIAGFDWRENLIDAKNANNVSLGDFANTAKGAIYGGGHVICYMESDDGVNWRRPNCGEFFYKTQSGEIIGTNIVFVGNHGPGISLNTHPQAGNGEPLFLLAGQADSATGDQGVAISWSDDGIHWESPVNIKSGNTTPIHMKADTHNQIFWSPELQRYIVISRGLTGQRTVLRMESKDSLTSVTQMKTVKNASSKLSYWEDTGAYWTDPEVVIDGTLSRQPYSVPILNVSNGYYIGIVSVANFDKTVNIPPYQSVHAELVWSPDTKNWYYINGGQPFIENAEAFALEKGNDYGMIYSAAPVVTDVGTKFFYAALPELHYFDYAGVPDDIKKVTDANIPASKEKEAITRTTTMNVATIENDHYAGYFGENGTLITSRFHVTGPAIKITADIVNGGFLSVAVLDESGNVIEGFGHDDFTKLTADCMDSPLNWKGAMSTLLGKNISLEFKINNAALYTVSGNIIAQDFVRIIPDRDSLVMNVGETMAITATIIPETAYDLNDLVYTSSDSNIAAVDTSGLITAVSEGAANITISTKDGKYACNTTVTVRPVDTLQWGVDFENGLSTDDFSRIKDGDDWKTEFSSLSNAIVEKSNNAHSGEYVFRNKNAQIALVEKNYGTSKLYQNVVNVWFYDDGVSDEKETYAKVLKGSNPLIGIGIKSSCSQDYYSYLYSTNQYRVTQIKRSEGWHLFSFDFTNGYPVLYIDHTRIAELPDIPEGATNFPMTGYNKVWVGWFTGTDSGCYFDDISVTSTLQLPTISLTETQVMAKNIVSDCILIVASYNKNAVKDVKIININRDTDVNLSETGIDTRDTDVIKAFLWNNLSDLRPLCKSISVPVNK